MGCGENATRRVWSVGAGFAPLAPILALLMGSLGCGNTSSPNEAAVHGLADQAALPIVETGVANQKAEFADSSVEALSAAASPGDAFAASPPEQTHLLRLVLDDDAQIDMWAHRNYFSGKVDYIHSYRIRYPAGAEEYLMMDAASRVIRYRDPAGFMFDVHGYLNDGGADIICAGPDGRSYRQIINLLQEAARAGITIPPDALSTEPLKLPPPQRVLPKAASGFPGAWK